MNKERAEWIEYNNPYGYVSEIRETDGDRLPNIYRNEGFWKGAEAMAEHLQSQPPTKEQLIKAFKIFYSDKVVFEDAVNNETAFDNIVEQILQHWR